VPSSGRKAARSAKRRAETPGCLGESDAVTAQRHAEHRRRMGTKERAARVVPRLARSGRNPRSRSVSPEPPGAHASLSPEPLGGRAGPIPPSPRPRSQPCVRGRGVRKFFPSSCTAASFTVRAPSLRLALLPHVFYPRPRPLCLRAEPRCAHRWGLGASLTCGGDYGCAAPIRLLDLPPGLDRTGRDPGPAGGRKEREGIGGGRAAARAGRRGSGLILVRATMEDGR
jgi:hypothetical protein